MTARNCYSTFAGSSEPRRRPAPAFWPAVVLTLCLAVVPLAYAEEAGRILFARGEAYIVTNDQRREAQRGDRIHVGDTLLTGDPGRIQIRFVDEGMVSLRANTELRIEAFEYDPDSGEGSSVSRLMEGAMRAVTGRIAGNDPGRYTVETPVATIGVRGTDFEPLHIPEGREEDYGGSPAGSYTRTHSGVGVLSSQVGELDVGPGQTGFVDDPMSPPTLVPEPPFFRQSEDVDDEEEEEEDEDEEAEEDDDDEEEVEEEEEAEDDEAEEESEEEAEGDEEADADEADADDTVGDDDFREESALDDDLDDGDGLFGDFDDDVIDDFTDDLHDAFIEPTVEDDTTDLIIQIR